MSKCHTVIDTDTDTQLFTCPTGLLTKKKLKLFFFYLCYNMRINFLAAFTFFRLQMDGKYAIAAAMALFNLQISKAIEILSTSKGQG
mgnify:CR=1 FL=1